MPPQVKSAPSASRGPMFLKAMWKKLTDKQKVKYVTKGFRSGWVTASTETAVLATSIYADKLKRKARPFVLFIAPGKFLDEEKSRIEKYRQRVLEDMNQRGADLSIAFIAEEGLDQLPCSRLWEMIFPDMPCPWRRVV